MKVVAIGGSDESDVPVEEELSSQRQEEEIEKKEIVRGGFTEEYLETMNQVLAQQPLGAVLEWCCKSLPNFYQVTSFGSAGMVVIHELHKQKLKV